MQDQEARLRPAPPANAQQTGILLSGFAETTEFALLVIDATGTINFVNAAAEKMFGYQRLEMLGQTLDMIIPDRLRGAHSVGVTRVGNGHPSKLSGKTVEVSALRRDGTEFPIELSLSVWNGPNGVAMGGMIRDISERRQRDQRLHRLAHHDPLTGLPNRLRFSETLQAELSAGHTAAALLLDLDGFKKVNDGLGHATGDSLLQALAVRLPAVLDAETVLARFGGDEFAVMLPGVGDPLQAVECAEAILEAFGTSFKVGDHSLKLGASVGIAIGPMHGQDAEELVASADLALYQAKQEGGRSFRLFEPAMRGLTAMRRLINDELIRAIGGGELVLHYQPQIHIRTGEICGAEALLRWQHPTRGLLFPGSFLPALETHTLALQVGSWILDEACRQAATWRAAGHPTFRISVNLFAAQVDAGNLAEVVADTLDRHNLAPDALEVEVTETIVLDNGDREREQFRQLLAKGVRVAFDDFGTGHASLSMLMQFPLTTLKIDRGFVHELGSSRKNAAIVRALLHMGREMGLDVVAEGIETDLQESVLLDMGCRLGQGFLHGKAIQADSFSELLRKAHRPHRSTRMTG